MDEFSDPETLETALSPQRASSELVNLGCELRFVWSQTPRLILPEIVSTDEGGSLGKKRPGRIYEYVYGKSTLLSAFELHVNVTPNNAEL